VLRTRLRELAASRVRFGYRRLTVLLRREGWLVNAKRIYRLYSEEDLQCGPRCARRSHGALACPRSGRRGRTKNGQWILWPPACLMALTPGTGGGRSVHARMPAAPRRQLADRAKGGIGAVAGDPRARRAGAGTASGPGAAVSAHRAAKIRSR
jgi:hypothetical protein